MSLHGEAEPVSSDDEGGLTREEIRDLLHDSDAFFLPTRGEGWGLPIAEAMAMALPVVVPNVPGPMAYTSPENSYILPVLPGTRADGFPQVDLAAAVDTLRIVHAENVHNRWTSSSASGSTGAICSCVCKKLSSKGVAARKTMQDITPLRVVASMVERIRSLAVDRGWDSL